MLLHFCILHFTFNILNSKAALWAAFGGPERIRTAVGAFAELCLATRPQDLLEFRTLNKDLNQNFAIPCSSVRYPIGIAAKIKHIFEIV